MRIWTACLLSALALLMTACAPQPASGPALWHIQDADSEIWLFGTVHVLPDDLHWRTARFDAAFASAEELVTETDVGEGAGTAALTARYGLLPPGRSLSETLPPNTQARLTRVLRSLRVEPSTIEPMRPWLAGLRLSFLFAVAHGQAADAGVEAVLLPEARARGVRLAYLETPEQQIRTLADLSEADQIRFLDSSLREIEDDADTLEALQRAWAAGDVAALDLMAQSQMRAAGSGPYAALITRRNRAWTTQIKQRLRGSGRSFYAVGAAHLVGDEGVVAMLRREGVSVDGP